MKARPIGFSRKLTERPQMRADDGDLARATAMTWDVVRTSNNPPWLFRAGSALSWIVRDHEGAPVIEAINEDRMQHMLATIADWRKVARDGSMEACYPPPAVVRSLLATPNPDLPVLSGIVTTPVFGRSGVLLAEGGYHADAQLYYEPAPGFELPEIPESPTEQQVQAARMIVNELFGDFPFDGPADVAHAAGLLLVGFLRPMIAGPTPLHLIEKPGPGMGATLMADVISTIVHGIPASIITEGRGDEEWRKRLTATLRELPQLVLIDNLRHVLDSSALAAALTARVWKDRILRASEMARLPVRCTWIATGNNPELSHEISRRVVRIRLNARTDRAWLVHRQFRHPKLLPWVQENRARLVGACLTLCRAWLAAGRPHGSCVIGSYEDWAEVIGGLLDVVKIPGFLSNLEETLATSNGDEDALRGFVEAWRASFGAAEVGTADLFSIAFDSDPPVDLGSGNQRSQRTRLGKIIGGMRDRVFAINGCKLRVTTAGVMHQAKRWRLVAENERVERVRPADNLPDGNHTALETNVTARCPPGQGPESIEQREGGEECERVSHPIGAHTHACTDDQHITSQRSPPSPIHALPETYGGEHAGEPCGAYLSNHVRREEMPTG